jgi:hypothetical protein
MSTYTQLQSRISDDLNRTDLTTQIQQCILLAIQHYKNERFWFNETTTTLTATVGQAYVTAPSDILSIDHLYITVSSRNIELIQKDLNTIIDGRPTSNGQPCSYCYHQNRFEFDRPAASAYSLPLYYVKELTALSSGSDTNGWTTDGEDLIVFHAEKKLYANVIKDQAKAGVAAAQERDALTAMRSLARARTTTGYTKAYYL